MLISVTLRYCRTTAVALALLLTTGVWADTWVQPTPDGTPNLTDISAAQPAQVDLLGYNDAGLRLTVDTPGIALLPYKSANGEFLAVTWPDAQPSGEIGAPLLPIVRRLFLVPPGAAIELNTKLGHTITIDNTTLGVPLRVQPRQAPIEKLPGARENAPFDFNPAAYAIDADYLADTVTVEQLGIVRGQHLWMMEIHPIAYNPVAQTITFRPQIDIDLKFTGGGVPSDLNPLPGVQNLVLNPEDISSKTRGSGNYLIITADDFEAQIAAFATHKASKGFNVSTYVTTTSSPTTIKSYIQSLWGGAASPDYILLVGDTEFIGSWTGGGEGSPDTDLQYTCMDGSTDWYPDIAIGRFPVDNASELTAVLNKTIYYDNAQFEDPDYLKRSVFMASEDNYTVSEGTHNWVIDNYMIPNEIDYLKLYCHTYNATTQQVRDAFNEGRFWGIYSGHGATTYWADGPQFSQSDVNNLTNENMYSLVLSFACVTGSYTLDECFTETWILAPSKAAVGIWGSSVNSYWTEDDVLEKRWFDSIFDEEDEVPAEFGPTCNDARMRFLAEMGSGSTTRRYFEMYNLMGDPGLRYPGSCSDVGVVQLDSGAYPCDDGTASIYVSDCGLNLDDNLVETYSITIVSDSEPGGEAVELIETSPNSAEFIGTIDLSTTDAVEILRISAGDTISVTYNDADDGSGNPAIVTATAVVDCTPPVISNVQVIDIEPRTATVTFDADETVRGTVWYGSSCGNLPYSASGGFGNPAVVNLTGLQDSTTYFFQVLAADEAGNEVLDDNNGMCYMFSTPDIPDFFTELFESGNDLADLTLLFVPNGTVDFYAGCAEEIDELPTDPAGGTTISLADDDYETINIGGGESVLLYGTSYSTFYVSSNGYITFGSGDTDYTEDLADHFSQPRIAGLYDDLNPSSGGTVSWKQEADRVVVTYLNVYEYGTTNPNTFQIEMFFNGDITISYLAVSVSDGLAGLSEGVGLDPDYYPSDLSNMGSCGPRPPTAVDGEVTTPANWPVTIDLVATDDGLPEPPTLDLIIGSLPEYGTLADPGAGAIDAVPYTLVSGGNQVIYTPDDWYMGDDYFQFYAFDGGVEPEGGNSNIAAIVVHVTAPAPEPQLSFTFDTDPGWTTEGEWEFGLPLGGGSHNDDPISGYTGNNVYGYNLAGDYVSNMPVYYLTSTAIDCSDLLLTELHFMRWLGVERTPYDHATVEISTDGGTWAQLWANGTTTIADTEWVEMVFDISEYADDAATVYLRWSMGPTDGGTTYPGWNIDDVAIWGVNTATPCPGDLDGDGDVDLSDLAALLANYGTTGGASYEDGDLDGDGDVDLSDLATLLAVYGTTC